MSFLRDRSASRRADAEVRTPQGGPPAGVQLIRVGGGKKVYQCVAGHRFEIPSAEVFQRYGFDWSWVEDVAASDPLAQLPVVGFPARSAVPPIAPSTTGRRSPFRTFEQYLALAMTNPNLIRTPLSEEDRRILAYMSYLRDRLADEHSGLSQDELVTVVIPTYERAEVVGQAIRSALDQSYRNLEVIVVDDASNDGTEAVVSGIEDERVTYIRHERNAGNAAARNTALRAASGTWVAYLDSDDTWDEHFIRILLGELRRLGGDFGYAAQRVLRPLAAAEVERRYVIRFAPFHRGLLENNNYISMISVLHRRSLLDRVGLLDEGFRRYVDWEFFLRLSEAAPPHAIPVVLSFYDQSEAATTVSRGESRDLHIDLIRRRLGEGRELATLLPRLGRDPEAAVAVAPLHARSTDVAPVPDAPTPTVVILSRQSASTLRACVTSVRGFSPTAPIVVVDSDSGREVGRVLDDLAEHEAVTILRAGVNRGLAHAVNRGIEVADPAADVVVLGDDALATPGWLEGLQRVALRPDVGIVVPRRVLPGGSDAIRTHVPGADPTRECDVALSEHDRNVADPALDVARGWVELRYTPLWCALITRRALELCGPLDEVRAPHHRAARAYCDAVRSYAGLKVVYTAEAKLYHFADRPTFELRSSDDELLAGVGRSHREVPA